MGKKREITTTTKLAQGVVAQQDLLRGCVDETLRAKIEVFGRLHFCCYCIACTWCGYLAASWLENAD